MNEKELLFYDIEVFKHDSLVIFKDINKKVVGFFHNDFFKLAELVEGKTLIGFNNYYYDDKILSYMLQRKPQHMIKELNDRLISGEKFSMKKPAFKSLDVFQQIDVSKPSLKKIEGNMGRKILESSVPFTIDKPLTDQQFKEVFSYCSYDIDTTIDVFKIRKKSYFQPKFSLVEMLGNEEAIKWNTTTISANLLLEKPIPKWSLERVAFELGEKLDLVPAEVRELWLFKEKGNISIEAFGNEVQFGFGGLHGAHKEIKRAKDVKLLDVKSMYPSIIILLNILGAATEKYKEILNKRLAIKHTDKILSDALKLILNSVYGNLNNEFSTLRNPNACKAVCFYGQIALFELCKRLAPFVKILNINTDGIAFIEHDKEDKGYIEVYKDWEQEFQLELEEKDFDLLVQKDVNNYIAVQGKNITCKGGDVNRYEADAFFKNNNARILDIALVDYLVHGKDVVQTIEENLDKPHLFQYILKAGNTYQGTTDASDKEYNKVNRVFATIEEGFCLFKKRYDNGLVRFADAPLNMYLWNQDCSEIENFEAIIDKTHYFKLIKKRLERWT